MNKIRQLVIIVVVIISAIVLVSIVFIGGGNNDKKDSEKIAETEKSQPVHSALYSPSITDVSGPFTIEYMYTKNRVDYIKVVDSSPQGRMNAIYWLRERGIDPTDLGIRFDDFTNPLNSRGD